MGGMEMDFGIHWQYIRRIASGYICICCGGTEN